jgi:hypothetical protein
MPLGMFRAVPAVTALTCALAVSGCGGVLKTQYEYEEELYLSLDGSATINVNASVASLVALRAADLTVDPKARLDRGRVRALFKSPGAEVTRVSLSRREGRRFVHVSVDVQDVHQLHRLPMFSWSTYQFERQGDVFAYRQLVGASAGRPVGDVGWTGREVVMFRMHIPSEIPYHNAPSKRVERGNILEWEQSLSDRLSGTPIDVEVRMEPESILYTTLLLFGFTVAAAAITFGVVIWWVARRGRESEELPRPAL